MSPDLKRGDLCVLLETLCTGFEAGKLVTVKEPIELCNECGYWHYNIYEDATDIVEAPRPYLRKIDDNDDRNPNAVAKFNKLIWEPIKEDTAAWLKEKRIALSKARLIETARRKLKSFPPGRRRPLK